MAYPGVTDAVVIGLPHPRFGSSVTAVVESRGLIDRDLDADEVKAFLRQRLAGYKIPRHIYVADVVMRYANGKPDYITITAFAKECRQREERGLERSTSASDNGLAPL